MKERFDIPEPYTPRPEIKTQEERGHGIEIDWLPTGDESMVEPKNFSEQSKESMNTFFRAKYPRWPSEKLEEYEKFIEQMVDTYFYSRRALAALQDEADLDEFIRRAKNKDPYQGIPAYDKRMALAQSRTPAGRELSSLLKNILGSTPVANETAINEDEEGGGKDKK